MNTQPNTSEKVFGHDWREIQAMNKKQEEEIKRCPFCNSEAFLSGKEGEIIECEKCHATAPVEIWNQRKFIRGWK